MKRKAFIIILFVCCAAVCLASATNVNGKWAGIFKDDDDTVIPITYTFKADGDKLSGSVLYAGAQYPITDGKIKGDSLLFAVDYNNNPIRHSARVYADSIGVNITIDYNIYHLTLKKTDK